MVLYGPLVLHVQKQILSIKTTSILHSKISKAPNHAVEQLRLLPEKHLPMTLGSSLDLSKHKRQHVGQSNLEKIRNEV